MSTPKQLAVVEWIIDRFLSSHVHNGGLVVAYPGGAERRYGQDADSGAAVTITLKQLPLAKLRNPVMFVGEGYMFGTIVIPEQQLDAFFQLMSLNQSDSTITQLIEKFPKRQPNRYKNQQKQVSHHYDIGNDYYKLWLDKSLTYSCAYFRKPTDSLETAQIQKTEHLLSKLQLSAGQTMLDIGCGWGHLSVAAAQQYGVRVVGITLGHEQLAGAQQLAKKAGVSQLVDFRLANYQDLGTSQTFDRIISVGMFEHVGRGNHADYFDTVRNLLTDDGISVLHTITQMIDKEASPWIDKYIFPGGYLPTIDAIEHLMAERHLWSIDRENLWQHYAQTLDTWRARHQAHKEDIISMFDETFYRMQDFWLAGSASTFRYGETGINQFIFTKRKPDPLLWPLTRKYIR